MSTGDWVIVIAFVVPMGIMAWALVIAGCVCLWNAQ